MDPVTHITTGALGAQVVRRPYEGRFITLFSIIASWLPDIDNLAGIIGPEFYIIHHRGITHSIMGGFFLSSLLVVVFRLFIRSFPIAKGFIISYLLILVHIFLDLITLYGTQIFFPFTSRRYSRECVFIIDPFYTFLMVIIPYLSVQSKINKKKIAILGLVWVFLYPMANLGIKYTLQNSIEGDLKKKRIVFERVHVLSEVFTPFF